MNPGKILKIRPGRDANCSGMDYMGGLLVSGGAYLFLLLALIGVQRGLSAKGFLARFSKYRMWLWLIPQAVAVVFILWWAFSSGAMDYGTAYCIAPFILIIWMVMIVGAIRINKRKPAMDVATDDEDTRVKSEILAAKKGYQWLWLSPLLTIPSFYILMILFREYFLVNTFTWTVPVSVLGAGLWHLRLLQQARNKTSAFVRWHGRQALLLAGINLVISMVVSALFVSGVLVNLDTRIGFQLISIVVIITILVIWGLGTWWGQRQVGRGDCALMRWTGQGKGVLFV